MVRVKSSNGRNFTKALLYVVCACVCCWWGKQQLLYSQKWSGWCSNYTKLHLLFQHRYCSVHTYQLGDLIGNKQWTYRDITQLQRAVCVLRDFLNGGKPVFLFPWYLSSYDFLWSYQNNGHSIQMSLTVQNVKISDEWDSQRPRV